MNPDSGAPYPRQGLLAWMVHNPVSANLLMLVLVVGGLVAAFQIKQEVFPEYDLDIVTISVSYPGATPTEVERGVVLAVEEAVRGVETVERVTSVATEGRAGIVAEVLSGANADKTLQEIKTAVDRVTSLPDEVERPVVSLQTRRREVLQLAISGIDEELILYEFAAMVRDELTALPEITQVELRGLRTPQINIEIPHHNLSALGLTIEEVAAAVRRHAVDVPGGNIKSRGGDILLRTSGRREFAEQFKEIAVISRPDGAEVRLESIADIREGFEDASREAYFNGRRAALFSVYRVGEETPMQISRAVNSYIEQLRASLPENVAIDIVRDRSDLLKDRLNLLLKNGALGLGLVLIALGLFLEARLAFWVALGIPISIAGSFLVIYALGGSINMVSLFAFIITLGIIVDDAIVVGENIYHKRQQGLPPTRAAIEGVREMKGPIVVAVATNIIAFIPLLFVPGSTGRFFAIMPAVVISVFAISLLECFYVLPAHLAYKRRDNGNHGFIALLNRLPRLCDRGLERFIACLFTPLLKNVLHHRYLTTIVALAALSVAYAYWDAGWINFSFRPNIQTDRVDAEVVLPHGSPYAEVKRVARRIEEAGIRTVEENGGREILVGVMTDIGKRGTNTAEVQITLASQGERKITTREFSKKWRRAVGDVPGMESLFFDYLVGPGGSKSVDVELTHSNPATLEAAARDVAAALAAFDGVTDIDDGYARGNPQLDFTLTPTGRALGLSSLELGRQVRHAFYGAEAVRQQRGRDEIKVMVRLPRDQRHSLFHLEEMLIRTPTGGEVPLTVAAEVERSRAYTEINRVDGRRVLNVTGNTVQGVANEYKVMAALAAESMPKILASHPGLTYSFEGRDRERRQAAQSLFHGILLTLPAIYACMAILLGSYLMPLLVMTAIPFGLLCALLGHIIMGYSLSIISVFGMIALCGVIVNNGMVFAVTARNNMESGQSAFDAALNGACRRFRPIMLTSITTFCGLAPMIFEQSVQARFLVPMAISLGFGIMLTTLVILLLTPALFVINRDILALFTKK